MKDALELAGKLGVGGGIGFLVGWLVVWWVEPSTPGGMALLIVITVVFGGSVAGVISKLSSGKDNKVTEDSKDNGAGKPKRQSVSQPQKSPRISDQWQC